MYKIACIPAYNEESKIANVVKRAKKFVDEVVVCDDGSTDNTLMNAQSAGAIVIKHEKNLGKGAALKSIFNYVKNSNADLIVTIDGDGQFLPEEIPKLFAPIIEKKSDIVIGYRFDDKTEMPSYRRFGNKVLDKMTSMASDLPFRDTQSGFRAYSKKAIDAINFQSSGFAADAEILINVSKKGLKISEEKVTVLYNTGGRTSTKDPISHSTEVITSLIEIIAIRHPLTYLGIPGFGLTIVGIIFSVIVLSTFNDTRYFSISFTLIALGALILGLLLLLMSVVLFSIHKASNKL
jgi:glycosyltransferase involved in cell wall biosynthesis